MYAMLWCLSQRYQRMSPTATRSAARSPIEDELSMMTAGGLTLTEAEEQYSAGCRMPKVIYGGFHRQTTPVGEPREVCPRAFIPPSHVCLERSTDG